VLCAPAVGVTFGFGDDIRHGGLLDYADFATNTRNDRAGQ
jgi:hypothetical protein